MNREKRIIVSCCNSGFTKHMTTLFVSILENRKESNEEYAFYVIDDNINKQNKKLLIDTLSHYNTQVNLLHINKRFFSNAVESSRIPKTAYYRIAIPELFRDTDVKRILYLDCDMIAVDDLSYLWEIDLKDYPLAAVEDAGFHNRFEKMGISTDSDLYFNSGLMLINVQSWLEKDITRQVLKYIQYHPEKLRFHDQDALNAILHDQWLPLHPSWNAQSYIINQEKKHPTIEGERQYEETRKHPHIIHYSGHVKPWHDEFTSPIENFYKIYYALTAFADNKANLNTPTIIYKRNLLDEKKAPVKRTYFFS
ncbi:glycosyltransferase family 8 protein [Enterococcus sp. BWB1-3]|uniref:glycosyltransferase family 8 protein n=1 Tax=unclassified Enterococcus TaxID=2608891 RepID=UPI0019217ED7|nr:MULTISPECIES: glycosyltransferase family 8 protein [unclassified Enterococcus]MBL1230598.1 glycosyltransferase family 8 protein [Enterococcus sp. BWB1-3]MCB5950903.1 glycosyltransferase family 8 protein [Enterococcus sp. BWT-B8]MCB5955539.1 glycosyltransferase family 8 protein [Enterococcus sp. CWB-B31]